MDSAESRPIINNLSASMPPFYTEFTMRLASSTVDRRVRPASGTLIAGKASELSGSKLFG